MSHTTKNALWVSSETVFIAKDLKGVCASLLYALEMASKDDALTADVLDNIAQAYARVSMMACDISNSLTDTIAKMPAESP